MKIATQGVRVVFFSSHSTEYFEYLSTRELAATVVVVAMWCVTARASMAPACAGQLSAAWSHKVLR